MSPTMHVPALMPIPIDGGPVGAIAFDAVKHLLLCRLERRPPRLDLDCYPHLPRTTVEKSWPGSCMRLLSGDAKDAA